MYRFGSGSGRIGRADEKPGTVHGVEGVWLAAEIARNIDMAAFFQYVVDLVAAQHVQHFRHARARARTMPSQGQGLRSEEHTSELQSLMRISYAVFCLKKKTTETDKDTNN